MKNTSLDDVIHTLQQATVPEDVFGVLAAPQSRALSRRYRLLAAIVHPDQNMQATVAAEDAFKRLQQWYEQAKAKVADRCYGRQPTLDVALPDGTPLRSFSAPLVGDLCDLYLTQVCGRPAYVKLVRSEHNNELMQSEASTLGKIKRRLERDALSAHFPDCITTILVRDAAGRKRYANVLAAQPEMVSLATVLDRYPQGVALADAAWMFNRLLSALGKTHEQALVHGAVVPSHVLIRPKDHNGMLIDWCYTVPQGGVIKAISPRYKPLYPPEVMQKRPASTATDLYMAAMTMLCLLGGNPVTQTLPGSVPKPIAALLRGCLIATPRYRANDAWELFDEFQDMLKRLYGPPTFRPFQW